MCDGRAPEECKCWGVIREAGTPNVHTYPFNDVVLHDCSVRCPCGPRWEALWNPALRSVVWQFVHHSADGREASE